MNLFFKLRTFQYSTKTRCSVTGFLFCFVLYYWDSINPLIIETKSNILDPPDNPLPHPTTTIFCSSLQVQQKFLLESLAYFHRRPRRTVTPTIFLIQSVRFQWAKDSFCHSRRRERIWWKSFNYKLLTVILNQSSAARFQIWLPEDGNLTPSRLSVSGISARP